jgi:hypothetical protein
MGKGSGDCENRLPLFFGEEAATQPEDTLIAVWRTAWYASTPDNQARLMAVLAQTWVDHLEDHQIEPEFEKFLPKVSFLALRYILKDFNTPPGNHETYQTFVRQVFQQTRPPGQRELFYRIVYAQLLHIPANEISDEIIGPIAQELSAKQVKALSQQLLNLHFHQFQSNN